MANTRDIRRRIKSVKNTMQITKAMQMVAASKMKKAQDIALSGRPYALLLADILGSLGGMDLSSSELPFFQRRDVKNRGILVVSSDKGLCGALNANLFRHLTKQEGNCCYVALGKRGAQFVSRTKRDLLADFPLSDNASFSEVRPAVEFLIRAFIEKKIDTVEVLYTNFINTLRQEPEVIQLLPVVDVSTMLETLRKRFGQKDAALPKDGREIHFEPDREKILAELAALYFKQEVYQLVLEAKASEHSARMVAMKSATDNAKSLIDDLTLEYKRVRQASITQEILEISAAAFAK
ncbi:MAG: ATP synthase F1 subunit gamma [Opitutae bacterium]|nr:ATP synthase F1 subunit gamma [Opitutae bacterium]